MKNPLLPPMHLHEWVFGAFLLVTAARLAAAGAPGMAAVFAALSVRGIVLAGAGARRPSMGLTRTRLLLYPVMVNVVYSLLGTVVARLHSGSWDAALLQGDRALLGETPSVRWREWSHPVLTEVLSGCYLLFFPGVLAAFVTAILRPQPDGIRLFNGLISVYALGFLGYTIVPAAGPHLAMPQLFPVPLDGGFLTRTNAALVQNGSNQIDVFPSLHAAVTVFLMGWLWTLHRRLFFLMLGPAVGLCFATLYLRYHYAADLAAGLALAAAGLWIARQPDKSHELHPPFR